MNRFKALAALLALSVCIYPLLAKKKKPEEITQTLELPKDPPATVTGGFATGFNGGGPTRNATFAASDDLSVLRGDHQMAFGGQASAWWTNSYTVGFSRVTATFNGQTTGLGMADYFIGATSSFRMGNQPERLVALS